MIRSSFLSAFVFLALLSSFLFGQEEEDLQKLDVDYMLRGYCYAGSKIDDERAPGGFGPSDNFPIRTPETIEVAEGAIQLVLETEKTVPFAKKYRGMPLYLVNGTDEVVGFRASDSRVSITCEAKTQEGTWKPIEYLPRSWCGNSYHRVFLAPGQCWRFAVPEYHGERETTLRFKLERQKKDPIYSAEFTGHVNPKQFTEKQGHSPKNLMDPYDE